MRLGAILALALLGVLAVSGTAVAQQGQPVIASVSAEIDQTPDELPGIYEVGLVVTVQASGGQCLCTETRVELVGQVGDAAEILQFKPAGYTIDWTENTGVHEQAVAAAVQRPAADEPAEVTFDVEMSHEPSEALVTSRSEPTTLELPLPTSQEQEESVEPQSTDGGESTNGTSSETTDEQNTVPLGGGLALVAVGAALARRRR